MRPFGAHEWDNTDFAILKFFIGFLSDNHFARYVKLMVEKQLPEIESFNGTLLYTSRDYDSIPSEKVFIQPCHCGSIHWTLLTNIIVEQGSKVEKGMLI